MKVTGEDAALAFLTALVVWIFGTLVSRRVVGASLSGGDFPRTSPGEWAVALGATILVVAAPALVIRPAWKLRLWLTVAVNAVLFLALSGLALWWFAVVLPA